jgi:hypothetical protein
MCPAVDGRDRGAVPYKPRAGPERRFANPPMIGRTGKAAEKQTRFDAAHPRVSGSDGGNQAAVTPTARRRTSDHRGAEIVRVLIGE